MKRDRECVSRLQEKVLKTNNFTSIDKPDLDNTVGKHDDKTFIIDDLNDGEAEIHECVDYIKNQVLKVVRQQKLKTQYLKMIKFKLRMSAVIKARKVRKHYKRVKLAIRTIQKHFKIILNKRINSNQIKNQDRYQKLKQLQFLQKQRELANKRKMKKQVSSNL